MRWILVVPVLVLLWHCGGQTASSSSTESDNPPGASATGAGSASVPTDHRPIPVVCPAPTSSPEPSIVATGLGSNCSTNEDCTSGKDGICAEDLETGAHCVYQACTTDADCGSGHACSCGTNNGRSECVAAQCDVDSDCGTGGYCSPSRGVDCGRIDGIYCHTEGDACVNDADCTVPGEICSSQGAAWSCVVPGCSA